MPARRLNFRHVSSGVLIPVLVLMIIAFGYFVGRPQLAHLQESRATLAEKQAAVRDWQTSVAGMNSLVAELERERALLAPVEEALPLSPNIPELLANLEFLTKTSGLTISNIQIEPEPLVARTTTAGEKNKESADKLGLITVIVSVAGQYPQLSAFILNLEKNLRVLDIQSINFGEVNAETSNQNYMVKLHTYYQK